MRRFIYLVLVSAISYSGFSQVDTAAISTKLEQSKSALGKNFAFALYKDGKIIYKREVGEFTIKTQEPINASSQWLTAALILKLVEEGKLGLDDKVSSYIPLFAKHGKAYITVRHCLTHNTGIDGGKLFEKNNFKTLEDEVNFFASNREIKTNPGTEFFYSNVGFKIAARVAEIVAKKPFDRLIKEKITSPLAMRNTSFSSENYNDAPDPSTGAKSTAFDYINFLSMLMNKGKFNEKQILSEESVQTLLTLSYPVTQVKNAPKQAERYDFAVGSWVIERNSKDEAIAFTAPALSGTYPIVDICRGYAFIVLTKASMGDIKKEVYLQIKSMIDESININCN